MDRSHSAVRLMVFQVHKIILDGEVNYQDSNYLLEFVNRFGEEGGFDLINEKISDKETPLEMISRYLKPLKAASKVFPPEFESQFLTTITGTLIERVQRIREDFSPSYDQNILQSLTQDVQELMKFATSHEVMLMITERILKLTFESAIRSKQENVDSYEDKVIGFASRILKHSVQFLEPLSLEPESKESMSFQDKPFV
jgi:hypothetical protein